MNRELSKESVENLPDEIKLINSTLTAGKMQQYLEKEILAQKEKYDNMPGAPLHGDSWFDNDVNKFEDAIKNIKNLEGKVYHDTEYDAFGGLWYDDKTEEFNVSSEVESVRKVFANIHNVFLYHPELIIYSEKSIKYRKNWNGPENDQKHLKGKVQRLLKKLDLEIFEIVEFERLIYFVLAPRQNIGKVKLAEIISFEEFVNLAPHSMEEGRDEVLPKLVLNLCFEKNLHDSSFTIEL